MHKTLVFVIFPLHSSVFYHRTEQFVKFGAVLHHDIRQRRRRREREIERERPTDRQMDGQTGKVKNRKK